MLDTRIFCEINFCKENLQGLHGRDLLLFSNFQRCQKLVVDILAGQDLNAFKLFFGE